MSSKASIIPENWEDAEPPSFSPDPSLSQKEAKGKAKHVADVKGNSNNSNKAKNAFSDDEEDQGHMAQPRINSSQPPSDDYNHDDDDDDDYDDFDDDFGEEGEGFYPGEDGDADFMVPVKKKEFERMFNVKVVNQGEATSAQNPANPSSSSPSQDDYVAPNEPLLLINWTRLSGGVITSDPTGALGGLTEEQREARDRVLDSILENFESRCEEIFKEGFAYHSDTSVWDRDLQKINKISPSDCWGPLGYPKVTGSYNIKDSWATISKPSKWNSVTAMKKCIGSCSRGIVWKLLLVEEIERLGNEQGKLLESGQVKLPDPKTRTAEEERKAAEQVHPSNFTAKDLNVLDKIIAMAFERTPVLGNEDTHFQTLAKKHFILKKLWFDEFGSLPKV